ncbi:hypothetical protein [Luteimonas composti]|uniref:hypothetical protein n=1 Tax=Luteimonas composti TaxID=398257 RepID=UPI0036D8CF69
MTLLETITSVLPPGSKAKNLESVRSTGFLDAVGALDRFVEAQEDSAFAGGLDCWHCFVLQNLLLLGMHFRTAHRCRRIAADRVLAKVVTSEGKLDKGGFLLMAGAVAEDGSKGLVGRLGSIYKQLPGDVARAVRPAMRGLALLDAGRERYRKVSLPTVDDRNDGEFQRYLHGRSVAIVGPVDSHLDSGPEIDGFDVVVRFNHTSSSRYDTSKHGSRTDVSYYTNPAFRKLVESKGDGLGGTRVAVLQDCAEFPLDSSSRECLFRNQYRRSNSIFFKSHGNAVQRALLDMLRFEVGHVKLFNMNLWLTPHSERYLARRSSLDPHTFIYHDAITNLSFLRRLLENGSVDADDVLRNVLGLSNEAYVSELAARHALP